MNYLSRQYLTVLLIAKLFRPALIEIVPRADLLRFQATNTSRFPEFELDCEIDEPEQYIDYSEIRVF